MPRSLSLLFEDMLRHCRLARRIAESVTDDASTDVPAGHLAIERCLQIIGEALQQSTLIRPDVLWRVTDARKIISLRHLLTHHYYKVSPQILWAIVDTSVPQLEREILAMQASRKDVGEEE